MFFSKQKRIEMPISVSDEDCFPQSHKCTHTLCWHLNPPMSVAGKHRCGGCKNGSYYISASEAAIVYSLEIYEEFRNQEPYTEIDKQNAAHVRISAQKRDPKFQEALQIALNEEESLVIDPFTNPGPLSAFETVQKASISCVRPHQSSASSRNSEPTDAKSTKLQSPSANETSDSSSLRSQSSSSTLSSSSAFSHRMNKPLPELPSPTSVRFDITPPLAILKRSIPPALTVDESTFSEGRKSRGHTQLHDTRLLHPQAPALNSSVRFPPGYSSKGYSMIIIPARVRPVSTLDVPEEIDKPFYDPIDV